MIRARSTVEGAGVKLKRVFGYHQVPDFDPFLMLDHFGSDNPEDYLKGFPWHPHRGIETVTYMIRGEVRHGDNMGNKDVIRSGEVQWMTAGSGIIHQEMPRSFEGTMTGFQLWVNLPAGHKMTTPRYMSVTELPVVTMVVPETRGGAPLEAGSEIGSGISSGISSEISSEIDSKIGSKTDTDTGLETDTETGAVARVIAGTLHGVRGPVRDLFVDVEYFDVRVFGSFAHRTRKKTVVIYVYEGKITIAGQEVPAGHGALLDPEGDILLHGTGAFILAAGDPLNEPVAWGGPIVMNTDEELRQAFEELNNGTFLRQ